MRAMLQPICLTGGAARTAFEHVATEIVSRHLGLLEPCFGCGAKTQVATRFVMPALLLQSLQSIASIALRARLASPKLSPSSVVQVIVCDRRSTTTALSSASSSAPSGGRRTGRILERGFSMMLYS